MAENGVLGFFDNPQSLLEAARKVRVNYPDFEAFTPYPVHGLDEIQGLRRSALPFVTFSAGLTGCALGFLFQYWTSVVDWPLNVGGKPLNSWPAFVPVMFELTILFAGVSTVFGMFWMNKLPCKQKAWDPSLTCDQFALWIETANVREVQDILKKLGAQRVSHVHAQNWFEP
jgi:hypothetical protein